MNPGTRGFVLVNALILVAALTTIAVLLLARAETGRAQLSQSRATAQITLNLDAFESLAIQILSQSADGGPDHLERIWAKTAYDVPLERGRVAGRIADLQGRFNVNWLNDPENGAAQAAFDRLLDGLSVSEQDGKTLRALLQNGGPSDRGAFLRLDPPQDPVGGALLMIRQLDRMPGLSDRGRELLRPYLTALPGGSKLNPNTADPKVLAAFLPNLSAPAIDQLLAERRERPFASVQSFMVAVGLATADETDSGDSETDTDPEQIRENQLEVSSEWFGLEITASVDGQHASRQVLLNRKGVPAALTVIWRLTSRP
ncbi:type II secretion system minor pseudopilin GspK [Thalassobius sp. S69A]|uniref:type II secretion system minor pseudopilin GspK n=1 Tax=unclassified Thalassovita TaxID=2619711 RepID=UPI000C1148F2|nr:hypothetical protein [Paracoccaceae bacterium]MBT24870.1 hypothetical protein [Paracoccaceae bacterium]